MKVVLYYRKPTMPPRSRDLTIFGSGSVPQAEMAVVTTASRAVVAQQWPCLAEVID